MNNDHTGRNILIVFLAIFLIAGSFSGGVLVGWLIPGQKDANLSHQTTPEPDELETLFAPFWDTWQFVHEQYLVQPVDDTKLMQGAIRGMLDSLGDKHTGYMDPDQYKQASEPLDGTYEGIGAYVDISGKLLTIISAMPGTPAERAGLKSGDEVIKINGQDVTGQDPSIVLKSVKGPAGTDVTVTIQRLETEEVLEFTITRENIELKSVIGEMKEGGVGYIQLSTFGENTANELKEVLTTLLAEEPKGLILDLRYNSGGYVTTTIEVISQFISEGVVMIEQVGDGEETTYSAQPGGLATEIPLVVLVNEGSASASEITAGAIQDYERGMLVGVPTYGKGLVQNWITLEDDQGAVRITIARWLTPKRQDINEHGLTPDVFVEITQEDIDADRDPQLEKAIEILLQSE